MMSATKENVVYVNGVRAGEISEYEYQELRNSVIKDPFVWLIQVKEISIGVGKILFYFSLAWIVITFWLTLFIAAKEPEIIANIVSVANLDAIQQLSSLYLEISATSVLVTCLFLPLFDVKTCRFIFEEETGDRVRRYLGIAANGNVSIRPNPTHAVCSGIS